MKAGAWSRRILVLAGLLGPLGIETAAAAAGSAPMFPLGDLQLTRDQISSSSFGLSLRNMSPPKHARVAHGSTHTYLIAGAKGRIPEVHVTQATYSRYYNGRKVETRDDTPPANDDAETTVPVVKVGEVGVFRQFQAYFLAVTVAQVAPESNGDSLWVLERLNIQVKLGPPDVTDEGRSSPDGALFRREQEIASSQLLNADIDPSYWIVPAPGPTAAASDWIKLVNASAKAGPVFRIPVHAPGIYSLAWDVKTSSALAQLPPYQQWRAFHNGREVALLKNSGEDASPFLVVPPDLFRLPNEEVYWLMASPVGDFNTSRPQQINQEERLNTTGTLFRTGTFEAVGEGLTDYHARLRPTANTTRWFWKGLSDGDADSFPLTLPEWFAPDSQATATLHVHYGLASYVSSLPQIRLYLNGQDLGLTTVTLQQGVLPLPFSSSQLKRGRNEVGLRVEYPNGGTPQDMLVQKLRLVWDQPITAESTGVYFKINGAMGLSEGDLSVPSNPSTPQTQRLKLLSFGPAGITWSGAREGESQTLTFRLPANSSEYMLFDPTGQSRTATGAELISELPELPSGEFDYIAVVHDSLTTASQPLLEHRIGKGFGVLTTQVTDVFNQFNFGKRDGTAIRKLLLHLFEQSHARKPQYLMLVGESSDYRGDPDLLPPGAQVDMVPTIGPTAGEGMHGDHGYGILFGDDALQDISVGRLPVSHAGELTALIAKIIAYEAAPPGEWSRQSSFVLDDNEEFPTAAEQVISRGMAPPGAASVFRQSDFPYDANMRVPGMRRSRSATNQILQHLNAGAGTLTFFGHGGPNLWSHERLFHIQDAPLVKNGTRLPLITCASCDNAWIDYPVIPVKVSIGELLVKKPDGGAIGLFGPVAGASPFEHSTLVGRLMEGIYRMGIRSQGMATLYAKNMYYAENRSTALPEQYLLLGDPAVMLALPEIQTLPISKKEILAGEAAALRLNAGKTVQPGAEFSVKQLDTGLEITSGPVSAKPLVLPPLAAGSYSVELKNKGEANIAAARLEAIEAALDDSQPEVLLIADPRNVSPLTNAEVSPLLPLGASGEITDAETPILRFSLNNKTTETIAGVAQVFREEVQFSNEVPFGPVAPGRSSRLRVPLESALAAGSTTLTLSLQTDQSVSSYSLSLPVLQAADLEFVPGTARVWSASGLFPQRETVFLSGRLRNSGGVRARNILLQALVGHEPYALEATTINDMKTEVIDELDAGEEKEVVFRWEAANDLGEHHVVLFANRGRSVKESNYDNNSFPMPPVNIRQIRNYSVAEFDTRMENPGIGEAVEFSMRFSDDQAGKSGPAVDIEYGFQNFLMGTTTSTRETLPRIDNDQVLTRPLTLPDGFTHAFVTVNATREAEELTLDDSTAVRRLSVAQKISGESEIIDLTPFFMSSEAYNFDPLTTGALALADRFSSTSKVMQVDEQAITTGSYTSHVSAEHGGDNAWLVAPGRLEALAGEDAGEIQFAFQALEPRPLTYEVFGHVSAARDENGTWGQFELRLGEEPWQAYDFSSVPGPRHRDVHLGQYRGTSETLSVSIRQTTGSSVWVGSFKVRPRVAVLTTPKIEFTGSGVAKPTTLRVDGYALTSENVWLEVRYAKGGSPEASWSDWISREGTELDLPAGVAQLQVRIMIEPFGEKLPVLYGMELRSR